MLSIVITSYKEPKTIGRAIESFISQHIKEDYELIVSAPDDETLKEAKKYSDKDKKVRLFKDEGKGKSTAINQLLPYLKGRIIILSDGDVYVSSNSVNQIVKAFEDNTVGCATGRPISTEDRETLVGYWSHMLCDAAHRLRLKRNKQENFLECSGYFWAFRSNIIRKFPTDVAEDSIVPAIFWLKRYKIKYISGAEVYVSYPKNIKDYIKQKKRTIKSHEKLSKYIKQKLPKMKTFSNEFFGVLGILIYPKKPKEIFYSLCSIPLRGYLWLLAYLQYFLKKEYGDNWERIESTK